MATPFLKTGSNTHIPQKNPSTTQNPEAKAHCYPYWYSVETGIFKSTHPSVQLPSDPFLDVVSFIFSHKHGGVSALVDSQSAFPVSYSELRTLVKSTASGLHQMDVSQGDVVMILLPNSIYFPVVLLGVLSIGAVVTTANPLCSLLEIKNQVAESNVSLVFTTLETVDKLDTLGIRIIGLPEKLMFDSKRNSDSAFHKLISCDPKLAPKPRIKQQDTAVILYSSGTTGNCKGVMLTHANFIATVELFMRFEASQYEHLSTDNVYLDVIPMFHVYGLSLFGMGLLSLGSTVVVMRKFDADEMVRAIDRYGVTHFPVVPPLLMALTRRVKDVSQCSMKSLKQVSCGAAPLNTKCIQDFVQTFPHVDFIQVLKD